MKKLSNILNESVWGGMLNRSVGDSIRKEDDVNLMDITSFVDYLNEIYLLYDRSIYIKGDNTIIIPLLKTKEKAISGWPIYLILQNYDDDMLERKLYFSNKQFGGILCKHLYDKLQHKLTLKEDSEDFTMILPKNGEKITNLFLIYALDTIIDTMDSKDEDILIRKNIKESVWGGMLNRSTGEVTRKEDDVNLLDPTDFAEYLQNHYTTVNYGKPADYSIINGNDLVSINVFAFKPFIADLYYHYAGEKIALSRIYADSVKKSYPEFFIKLEECFSIEIEKTGHETNRIIFNPKDNSPISNAFFIEVLDKLIEIVDEWISKVPSDVLTKLIKKKGHMNESVWGCMLDRSVGDSIRKEDELITNIKDIIPVDLGLSVLWADKDLEINDENEFTIDEIVDYAPDGWRRPTQKEADELLHNTKKTIDQDLSPKTFKRIFKLSNNGVDIYFSCKNLKEKAEYWELDKGDMDKYWNTFALEESGSFVAHSAYQREKLNEKHRVRFVREK